MSDEAKCIEYIAHLMQSNWDKEPTLDWEGYWNTKEIKDE